MNGGDFSAITLILLSFLIVKYPQHSSFYSTFAGRGSAASGPSLLQEHTDCACFAHEPGTFFGSL
ncbi:MAG: hypothetical protein BGO78_11880 [Chloroflexi bacterium 44-23]|nr:MAG: hypothetical protein BGO78_11880 [Chloroflexi bacterium 44-23]